MKIGEKVDSDHDPLEIWRVRHKEGQRARN